MIKTVFILGNHIQALGLARQVQRLNLDTILFTDTKYSITRFSNAVMQTIIFRTDIDLLGEMAHFNNKPMSILILPTNDNMIEFLCQNYDFLSKSFYLGIPEPNTIKIFSNKCNAYRFASRHNIPIPESFFPESIKDIIEFAEKAKYPVIIKPAIMHTFHKIYGKKAIRCDDKQELISRALVVAEKLPVNQIIIQEFLEGGAKALFSYGTFAVNGVAIASLIANRTRQNPMTFGNSTTFAITCNIPEIKLQAEKLLKLTNYYGLAEVEFMYDKKTNLYKFLEINTRAWKWHSISNGLGFSFIGKMISHINSNDTTEIKDFDHVASWIERLTDTYVIIKELFRGNNMYKELREAYKHKRVYAVWDSSDIKPFIMYLLLSPILFFTRH